MNYIVIRSKRKSVAIMVNKNSEIIVRVPMNISNTEIDRIVSSKDTWIKNHMAIVTEHVKSKKEFSINYGDSILYRGCKYPIMKRQGNSIGFDNCFFCPQNLEQSTLIRSITQIYKTLAKELLTEKVTVLAALMNVSPIAVKITSAKTRWGSCSGKNSLNFSWKLIMAKDSIIDYVVVHELAHIIQHNHSDKFWAIVRAVLPDYLSRERELKAFGEKLLGENW